MNQETPSQPPVLAEIVTRVVRALEPERVYLFGSRARGDAGDDSDFDLLIVVPRSDLPGHARDRIALRSLRGLRVPIDAIVLTHDEFERKRHVASSLPGTIDREGKLLYAA
jgi:predicted nucleotidyltransferase